jgi:pimeloyl-ACP methyl ester carboxylesterase
MSTIITKDGIEIFYKDWGQGQPIVFSHGWPLSADDWDAQMMFFLAKGFRVIAHDRRGHGRSTQSGMKFSEGKAGRPHLPRRGNDLLRPSVSLDDAYEISQLKFRSAHLLLTSL